MRKHASMQNFRQIKSLEKQKQIIILTCHNKFVYLLNNTIVTIYNSNLVNSRKKSLVYDRNACGVCRILDDLFR